MHTVYCTIRIGFKVVSYFKKLIFFWNSLAPAYWRLWKIPNQTDFDFATQSVRVQLKYARARAPRGWATSRLRSAAGSAGWGTRALPQLSAPPPCRFATVRSAGGCRPSTPAALAAPVNLHQSWLWFLWIQAINFLVYSIVHFITPGRHSGVN